MVANMKRKTPPEAGKANKVAKAKPKDSPSKPTATDGAAAEPKRFVLLFYVCFVPSYPYRLNAETFCDALEAGRR